MCSYAIVIWLGHPHIKYWSVLPLSAMNFLDCEMMSCFAFCSNFSEIFDVDWFISYLSKDVKIIKQLPRRGGKTLSPYNMRVPRKCNERCYINRILPVLLKKHVSILCLKLLPVTIYCVTYWNLFLNWNKSSSPLRLIVIVDWKMSYAQIYIPPPYD